MKKIDDLIEKNGKFFEKNSIQPFTGKVEGQIKGYLKDGMPEGTWQEFSQKGKISTFQKTFEITFGGVGWSKTVVWDLGGAWGPLYTSYDGLGRFWKKKIF